MEKRRRRRQAGSKNRFQRKKSHWIISKPRKKEINWALIDEDEGDSQTKRNGSPHHSKLTIFRLIQSFVTSLKWKAGSKVSHAAFFKRIYDDETDLAPLRILHNSNINNVFKFFFVLSSCLFSTFSFLFSRTSRLIPCSRISFHFVWDILQCLHEKWMKEMLHDVWKWLLKPWKHERNDILRHFDKHRQRVCVYKVASFPTLDRNKVEENEISSFYCIDRWCRCLQPFLLIRIFVD